MDVKKTSRNAPEWQQRNLRRPSGASLIFADDALSLVLLGGWVRLVPSGFAVNSAAHKDSRPRHLLQAVWLFCRERLFSPTFLPFVFGLSHHESD